VIGCVPAARLDVLYAAWPPTSGAVASVVPASWKVTVPVGVPEPGALALTVAVNVTDCPGAEGFTEETTVVLLPSWLTVCDNVVEVLPVKFVSPA
jgi:hypothetical protein